jgi:hypothetical protein
MSVFFFILGLNLWGQVPFLGSVNVTGTLSVTGNTTLVNANVTQNLIANNFNGNANTKIFTAIESAEATALAFSIALG